jgi:hypothetical protein
MNMNLENMPAANNKIAATCFCWASEVFELRKAKNMKLASQI